MLFLYSCVLVRPFAVVTCIFLVYFSSNRIEYCFRIVYRNVYRIGYLTLKKLRNALEQWFLAPSFVETLNLIIMEVGSRYGQTYEDEHQSKEIIAGTVQSARPERRLEKGSAYVTRLRWMDCYSLQRKIKQQIERITEKTANTDDVNSVENELSAFRATSEELKKVFAALMDDLENDEDVNAARDWYVKQSTEIIDFIEQTERWISSAKEKIENSLESRSNCSNLTGSSRLTKGSSTKSSIASGRAKERAKTAELMAKFAMLERKQELQKRAERLHLEEQLAVAQARERAYAEFQDRDSSFERKLSETTVHPPPTTMQDPQVNPLPRSNPPPVPHPYHSPVQLEPVAAQCTWPNPLAPEFKVKRGENQNIPKGFREVLSQQNRLTELLVEQQQQTLLPTLTISKFTGNPLDFFTFVRTFESQIESKLKSNDVRLRYLEQYVEGEPKELIKGCLHLDGQNGYTEAMKLLVEKYGDPYKISNAYIKKIEDWPYVKQGDDQALDRFATFLTQCRSAMSELKFLSTLDHPHNI